MQSLHCILALQHRSVLNIWIKITAACRARRVTLLLFLGVILLVEFAFSAPNMLVTQAAAATRPNIVVIMTDDQRLDDLQVMSKTLSLLGDHGTTFRNYYVSYPLCCPSRATFLTGQYPHNHGVMDNTPPNGGYTALNHANTLAVWLQDASYFTSHIGKYLNGYERLNPPPIPPGWSDWQAQWRGKTIVDNGVLVQEEGYITDVLADRAVETIGEAVQLNQPFFLSIATTAPHVAADTTSLTGYAPPKPAPRHVGAFADEPLPRPPSFNEADVSDKPAAIRKLPRIDADTIQEITELYRGRLATLLGVDDLVERVVNKLARLNVLDNTMLIFTSDNGWFQGEHRIPVGKSKVYEEDTHVPLLIRGPGFPPGVTRRQFVSTIDLAPTLVDLADATPGLVMDGRSLLPLAQDSTLAASRNLLIEIKKTKAVRNKSFLYAEYSTGERELYDMRSGTANYDPYQLKSRHASSAYNQIRSELANKLSILRTCSGASC